MLPSNHPFIYFFMGAIRDNMCSGLTAFLPNVFRKTFWSSIWKGLTAGCPAHLCWVVGLKPWLLFGQKGQLQSTAKKPPSHWSRFGHPKHALKMSMRACARRLLKSIESVLAKGCWLTGVAGSVNAICLEWAERRTGRITWCYSISSYTGVSAAGVDSELSSWSGLWPSMAMVTSSHHPFLNSICAENSS